MNIIRKIVHVEGNLYQIIIDDGPNPNPAAIDVKKVVELDRHQDVVANVKEAA